MSRSVLNIVLLLLVTLATGCGLSEREKSVARANSAIERVEAAAGRVADAIAGIAEAPEQRDLVPLTSAIRGYQEAMDSTNVAMRELAASVTGLRDFVDETFRTEAENAATACQEALDALGSDAPDDAAIRRSITRVGLCIDRYSAAVTNVSTEYSRVQN